MILSILIFLPILAALPIYLAGRVRDAAARLGALAVAAVELAISLYVYYGVFQEPAKALHFQEGPIPWITVFPGIDYLLGVDGLAAPLLIISSLLTLLVVLGSWDLIKERQATYYALVLFFEGTIIGVFTSLNLMLFYVFWELVLLPMFFFIGVWGGPRRRYAAVKFLLFTYTGSVVMLLGFLALYLTGGFTFNLTELKGIPVTVQIFASIATFFGFGVKLPVFPLHTWLPDAHVEAPSPISVFLAGLLLKMGGYGFLRINLGVMPEASQQLAYIFMGIGVVTMLYGAVVAMIQTDLKRLIALTSINHMGFVIFGAYAGIASGTLTGLKFGVSGAIFQMFNHAAAIGILFMLSGYIHEQAGTRQIPSLRGLRWGMPRTATLLILGSMAGMGVPVFSSFISEYYIIVGAISVNVIWAVAILIPAVTVAYFLWMLRRTVMTPMEGGQMHDMSQRTFVIMTLYLIPLLLLLLFPSLILDPADAFSAQLFAAGR